MVFFRFFFITCLAALCCSAQANDSAWGDANGTITLLKQNDISMTKERLLISEERINVDYLFTNHSKQDITLPVTFPMPAIYKNLGTDKAEGIFNFKLSVEGKPVKTKSKWVVLRFDEQGKNIEDITEKVLSKGLTINQLIKELNDDAPYEPSKENKIPAEWFSADGPLFYVQQHFTWQQTFPAGKEIVIHHSYTPSLSGGVPTNIDSILSDATDGNSDNNCLTNLTRQQLHRLDKQVRKHNDYGNIDWKELNYVLSSGANWKDGVINDFALRIHKRFASDVVTTCFRHPLSKIDPLTLEFKAKNFKPDEDLQLFFYSDPDTR